eukprot:scaffold253479_cov18-Prasinocladus_malaysianus.AAC.1
MVVITFNDVVTVRAYIQHHAGLCNYDMAKTMQGDWGFIRNDVLSAPRRHAPPDYRCRSARSCNALH